MFRLIKQCFFSRISIFIKPKFTKLLINNQECKVTPQIVNVTVDDPVFFSFSIKTSKCSGS